MRQPPAVPLPGGVLAGRAPFRDSIYHLDGGLWSNRAVGRSKDILLKEKKAFVGEVTL